MQDLVWEETLSIEVPEIDEEHCRLIDLFNILCRSAENGDTNDHIEVAMEELISCTLRHFRHEERLMLKYYYEGLAEHKSEHEELLASAKALQQKLLQEGKRVLSEHIPFLRNWLIGHILAADKILGSYLCKAIPRSFECSLSGGEALKRGGTIFNHSPGSIVQ